MRAGVLWTLSLLVLSAMAGCGAEWFPNGRQPTTPDVFSFPAKTNVPIFENITSDPITVSGLTASSPISLSAPVESSSKYIVNGGTPTSAVGSVNNGDTVRVQQISASVPGGTMTTTLFIGNASAPFSTTTVPVLIPTFTAKTGQPAGVFVPSDPVTLQASDNSTHQISVVNGSYALDSLSTFTSNTQTVAGLNARQLFLRVLSSSVSGQSATVTVTIDGVKASFTATTQ